MPEYLAPGVFVEETSFRQKTIEGVGTSTAAFVGPTRYGPTSGLPELLTNFGDFERIYGGVDALMYGSDEMMNYVAAGVRSFFENGGRRCYVSRAVDGTNAGAQAERLVPEVGAGQLRFHGRYPGRAGNFQVTLTLRMGPNVLNVPEPPAVGLPSLRGVDEYQVVWVDNLGGQPGVLAYLHDEFDADANEWTYDLRAHDGTDDASIALVTKLDTLETTKIYALTVDVEIGRLGRFLDPQAWAGLSLHPEHRNSIQAIFADDGDRATQLFNPLVVEMINLDDGPAVAELLLTESGAAAGLAETGLVFSTGGAIGGSAILRFTPVGGGAHADVTIAFDDTAAEVATAINGTTLTGALVSSPGAGTFVIAVDGDNDVVLQSNQLSLPGGASVRIGTRFVVDSATPAGRFALNTGGRTTASMQSNASADRVDDELEAIVGLGNSSVTRSGDDLTITLWGAHDATLTVIDSATLTSGPTEVTELAVVAGSGSVGISIDGSAATIVVPADPEAPTAAEITAIEASIAAIDPGATVAAEGDAIVTTWAGPAPLLAVTDTSTLVAVAGSANPTLEPISESLAEGNPAVMALRLEDGTDGDFPDPTGWAGDDSGAEKSGLGAFTDLPDVSIVAAPGSTARFGLGDQDASNAKSVIGHLIAHCERMRYRIAVVDSAPGQLSSEVLALRGEFDSKHAAMYYPWVTSYDPVTRRSQNFPPSGYVTGIYARNDISRGVHKAPANETIALAVGFETTVNVAQQEVLNPAGVNCLRKLDQRGRRVWGARTMTSDPEWKYVNLRRYFAFLEASIDRGTQWAVFEPNGPLLWDNVRRTVEDFLLNEFASNHLLGTTPEEAFFVRCDRSTMTQNDLDNGRLVCQIGVSPLRPAEFVIFRIGQKTMDFVL